MATLTTDIKGVTPLLPLLLVGLGIVALVSHVIYNLFFHPLRIYPGPKLWAATSIPYSLMFMSGKAPFVISSLHEKYGDIVRTGPNKLSYTDPKAWTDIKGHRKAGHGENGKDQTFFHFTKLSVLGADRETHSRTRRALAYGFSAKTMQDQEPLIGQYIDLFTNRLRGIVQRNHGNPTTVNLVSWFNFTTFDIIGDLAFGSPFDCLETSTSHPWIETLFNSVQQFAMIITLLRYAPSLFPLVRSSLGIGKPHMMQRVHTKERIEQRLQMTTDRPDFIDALMSPSNKDGRTLSREEIEQNMALLVLAGSETTATALSGAAYYLCKHPEIQKRLAEEVRSSFDSEDEINMQGVSQLKYMLAVLDETMRIYPPVSASMPRICMPGGDIVCGKPVNEGAQLDVWAWAMTHSTKNFTSPNEFIPERWTADNPRFPEDRKEASQPFSTGPRNCIGKNLAYVEMRLILARLIWNFDIEFEDREKGLKWLDQKSFNLWVKPALDVKLIPVQRE